MLLGREAERARVGELLAGARRGASAALVVSGEPGIGKSVLLDDAAEQAGGMTVLRARGVESESELSFAGLADLLRPVLGERAGLPAPQAAALAGAFALGPPVAGDRFTVYVAALGLLAAAGERSPVLAVVDDLPWMDFPSREALVFVARRLRAESVVLLLATRTDARGETGAAGVPELALGGLDLAASSVLLAQGGSVAPAVAQRLFEATGGNPLGLLEISGLLSAAQRAGGEPIEDPPPVGTNIERAFARQLESLGDATRHALLVAAASESGAIDEIATALASLGFEADALEPAERAGLVEIANGTLAFRHPLLRSVAYRTPPAPERRAAHRALAAALASGERSAERRAWHLAAATAAPDDEVATALVEAAATARARGGPAAAVLAGEQAARLTPDRDLRARRLLEAADDLSRVGGPERAQVLLGEALELATEPLLRADIQLLHGLIEGRGGRAAAAAELLVAEAERVAELDAVRATTMMMAAVQPCFQAGETAMGLGIAERAHVLAQQAGLPPMPVGLPLAMALLLCGERPRARPLLVQAVDWLELADDPFALGPVIYFGLGQAFAWLGEYERARPLLDGGIEQARAWSAPALLPYGLLSFADLEYRTGRWASAYAAGTEGAELAEQTGQLADRAYALAMVARVEAVLGREEQCRARLAEVSDLADRLGAEIMRSFVGSITGLLELGFGRGEEAIAALEALTTFLAERPSGDPEVLRSAPDLIEAYVRVGRLADARAALAAFEHEAQHSGGAWALSATARCHGLLAAEDAFEERFEAALSLHDSPFETARTNLSLGERLRRAGRRIEAREALRAALGAFDQLGAQPWAERAHAELRASGERARRGRPAATGRLTPQEVQVALKVAEGATNREAAAALFLSPKTIEFHLRNIYRKLGISSRTQLVRAILSPGDHSRKSARASISPTSI